MNSISKEIKHSQIRAHDFADLEYRRKFMKLSDEECASIRLIKDIIDRELPVALEVFYEQVRKTPETSKFFSSEAHIERAKHAQQQHWKNISSANFDQKHAEKVYTIGNVHARIGLEPRWYIGGYAIVMNHLIRSVISTLVSKPGLFTKKTAISIEEIGGALASLCSAVMLEMDLTISVYQEEAEKARQKSRDELIQKEQTFVADSFGIILSEVAERNLSQKMDKELPSAYIPMRDNLNGAIESLRDTLEIVNDTTETIDITAGEINSAAQDLAHRTEQQAISVEKTASAVEQITATVTSTAARVTEANAFVSNCQNITEQFGVMINRATAAMSEIEKSSEAISKITNVMSNIAIQTNLLALNTGVEAARAGEAGSGFRVLAQEIRDLANRAGNASKEVKELVETSREQVLSGVSIMEEAGHAISTIISSVADIGDHLKAIAEAASEQATALQEVNNAVSSIDQGTRQNAAMVEETSAASSGMAQQARRLKGLLNEFTLS
ncbi:protoglobin domain-containing protein [Acetobacter sp.]|jgi:methyl-accepting chemotaxis protein|uniref:protoglobin domain-containing protein n=1 Tax=Acetobacter sp. TaxID=440 RepID=UPI0039EADBB5